MQSVPGPVAHASISMFALSLLPRMTDHFLIFLPVCLHVRP